MDLLALCEGSYEDALAFVEKTAEARRAGLTKEAAGLAEALKGYGAQANDWANKHIGAAVRGQAAARMGNWWRDASADPAKLGLMGAGAGAGLGLLGSAAFGKPGRKRPGMGMLLGGMLGAGALGGYGLIRNSDLFNRTLHEKVNENQVNVNAAREAKQTAEMAKSLMSTPKAVGRDLKQSLEHAANNNASGAVDSAVSAAGNADVLGAQELFDTSGKNDSIAPSSYINEATRKATGMVEQAGGLNRGEGDNVADYLKLPTVNPAIEGVAALGATDAALSARANSLYKPDFLRRGLTTAGGTDILNKATGGHADVASTHLQGMSNGRGLIPRFTNNPTDLRTALGARLPDRLARGLGFSGWGGGTTVNVPQAAGAVPVPTHVSSTALRSVAAAGREQALAEAGAAKGFWRSGFGSAGGGRLGGIGVPRAAAYAAVPAGIHWGKTRTHNYNSASNQLNAAEGGLAEAQKNLATAQGGGITPLPKTAPATPIPGG